MKPEMSEELRRRHTLVYHLSSNAYMFPESSCLIEFSTGFNNTEYNMMLFKDISQFSLECRSFTKFPRKVIDSMMILPTEEENTLEVIMFLTSFRRLSPA
ncbi:unnamed protein product [Moneuplotes crassus]|uniref:Uncharacterized protein n=1 Tax=Euplotes crassus TaxID=5936 RepID=A0AAD1UQP9_EUPCR|nr:unnamed protein product [Moneuplotes crassus]